MGVNIILLTNDTQLRGCLSAELSKIAGAALHTQSQNIFQAASLLLDDKPNVIVLDFDEFFVTRAFTLPLKQHYPLLFIAFGHPALRHAERSGLAEVLPRPAVTEHTLFAREVALRVARFTSTTARAGAAPPPAAPAETIKRVILFAASTGGTEALTAILTELPEDVPPILIVQHMPATFTMLFAQRMNELCRFTVKEAESGDFLRRGLALIAPGDLHMKLTLRSNHLAVECFNGEKIQGLRPAANVLFDSALPLLGKNAVGVILTGMGMDGASGLKALHDAGAVVIGQDESTSAVYGMPRAAYQMGAVDYQLPLSRIAGKLMELI